MRIVRLALIETNVPRGLNEQKEGCQHGTVHDWLATTYRSRHTPNKVQPIQTDPNRPNPTRPHLPTRYARPRPTAHQVLPTTLMPARYPPARPNLTANLVPPTRSDLPIRYFEPTRPPTANKVPQTQPDHQSVTSSATCQHGTATSSRWRQHMEQ